LDSFTHIVLGAALGEAIAGKKLGNRAMLWGAIGCTVPDFDVFAAFFTDQITSTSFHRGIMHSLLFTAISPWLMAWLTTWFYAKDHYRRQTYKAVMMSIWILFFAAISAGINFIPVLLGEGMSWYVFIPTLLFGGWLLRKLWYDYWKRDLPLVEAPYKTWLILFFVTILAHPLLDAFTNWGTQIWQPFADTRVQWCTMAVADPLCTIPFAVLFFTGAARPPQSTWRTILNWLGLVWFCGYICVYSVWHKQVVNQAFRESLQSKSITYSRFYTNPSILNNIAWYGVAEGDTAYYYGMYSFNDRIPAFKRISTIPKNRALMQQLPENDRAHHFIRWFSDGYYNAIPYKGDTLQVNDLRFGLLGDSLIKNNYVFPFLVFKTEQGVWDAIQHNKNPESVKQTKSAFNNLWQKVKGD
jgi:inner membrane protein